MKVAGCILAKIGSTVYYKADFGRNLQARKPATLQLGLRFWLRSFSTSTSMFKAKRLHVCP